LKQKWDYIFYTGNGTVGRIIMKAAAENLTPLTLELGGKCPCIVDKTANLDISSKRILWGKFTNCGQTCVAPDYLLVEKSIENDLVDTLKKNLQEFFGEDPQKCKDYSRIIDQKHTLRLGNLIDRAKKEGAELVVGGKVDPQDKYVAPTIFRNVKLNSALMESENFGPIMPIITVNSIQEAVDIINSRDKPLAAYIFSSNKSNQEYLAENTSSGGLGINENVLHVGNCNLPFGGVGPSGIGSYHGIYSFKLFSHSKSVFKRGYMLDAPLRYPPYTAGKLKQLAFLRSVVDDLPSAQLLFGVSVALFAIFVGMTPIGREHVATPLRLMVVAFLRNLLKMLE